MVRPLGSVVGAGSSKGPPPHPQTSCVPGGTCYSGRNELVDILQGSRGRKALVLDTALGGLLVHIIPEVCNVPSPVASVLMMQHPSLTCVSLCNASGWQFTKFLKQQGVVHLSKGLWTKLSFLTPQGTAHKVTHSPPSPQGKAHGLVF